mgnify:FL=1
MSEIWNNENIFNYKKIRTTKFEKAVAHYICKIQGINPMQPSMSIRGPWYYRQWEHIIINGDVKRFIEHFKEYDLDFSGEII